MLEQRLQSSKEAEKSINDSMVRIFQHYLCTSGGEGGREGGREGGYSTHSHLYLRVLSVVYGLKKNIFIYLPRNMVLYISSLFPSFPF